MNSLGYNFKLLAILADTAHRLKCKIDLILINLLPIEKPTQNINVMALFGVTYKAKDHL